VSRLHAHPVPIGTPPDTLSCDDLCAVLGLPLAQVSAWKGAAEQLQQLWTGSATGRAVATSAKSTPYTGQEQSYAVRCSDSANPRDPRAYTDAARLASARSGLIGLSWVWPDEPCANWPRGRDAYTAPWNRRTANPTALPVSGRPAPTASFSTSSSRRLFERYSARYPHRS
jgi:hypothetical protein